LASGRQAVGKARLCQRSSYAFLRSIQRE